MKLVCALVIYGLLGIESPGEIPRPAPETNAPRPVMPVEKFLAAHPELNRLNEGYRGLVAGNPTIGVPESDWTGLLASERFRPAAHAFDEGLLNDPEAQGRFDSFYGALSGNPALRQSLEQLQHTEFGQRSAGVDFSSSIEFLRSSPEAALPFLEKNLQGGGLPKALQPLMDIAKQNPQLLGDLKNSVTQILQNPSFSTDVQPWLSKLGEFDQRSGGAYRQLATQFMACPPDFEVWHKRNLALAQDPHARDWIRYWHGVVRRTPELGAHYYRYLHSMDKKDVPAAQSVAQKVLAIQNGAWPPPEAPPPLQGYASFQPLIPAPPPMPPMPALNPPGESSGAPRPAMPKPPAFPGRPAMRTYQRERQISP